MTTHHHQTELDSAAVPDSAASSPRSDNLRFTNDYEIQPCVRFMCSFGGKILPRPHDNQLRYVGGDTRIVAVQRQTTTFSSLLTKLSKISGTTNLAIKYQLPSEDLDALISITTDEDVENMIEEYDRFHHNTSQSQTNSSARLRLFLFPNDSVSRTGSISSLLDGSSKRENWFLDALNGGSGLQRGRSEVSSILSEMPDYLFGLDSSDDQTRDPKMKTEQENVPYSGPGSPNAVASSPFCSISSSLAPPAMPSIPELPPIKINFVPVVDSEEALIETFMETGETFMQTSESLIGYPSNPTWTYVSDPQASEHAPFYYVPNVVVSDNVPTSSIQIRTQYVRPFPAPSGQIPVGFHHDVPGMSQVYGGGVRPVTTISPYIMAASVIPEGMSQSVYYGVRNAYLGMVVPGGEEQPVNGPKGKDGRVFHS